MTEKIDYTSWDESTAEFLPKLRRVFQDINIRVASIEETGRKLADIERRYGVVALERISEAITPAINEARELLKKVEADLILLDQTYRQDGQQRVDDIINPLLEQSRALLEKVKTDLEALDRAYRQDGQQRVDDIINPLIDQAKQTLRDAQTKLAEINDFLISKQSIAEKAQPNGYASLDNTGKVPTSQLPALTNMATVGAALATPTPSEIIGDGDRLPSLDPTGTGLKLFRFSAVKTWIQGWLTKAMVGLGNTDNTSDANKPVSTAQAAADALRVLKSRDSGLGFFDSVLKPSVATGAILKPPKTISNFQSYGNLGNFELQAPDSEVGGAYTMQLFIWAGAGAGAMTATGFNSPPKGTFNPAAVNLLTIRVIDTSKYLTIEEMV